MRRALAWLRALLARAFERWGQLGRRWRVALTAAFVLVVGTAGFAGFSVYNYMEHANEFCLSCHLMADPFQRFQRSAHAEIECHDCHKSSRIDQAWQLYATIFRDTKRITKHAHVPNQLCENCHVSGDSVKWEQIASSAGHRVHLESQDSVLRGQLCTDCHSTSVHAFASADRTCLKAGCHPDGRIKLGQMAQLDIYCATCHDFLAAAPGLAFDSLGRPLTPQTQQCFSCHEMEQRLADFEVALDPHEGVCGDCHNPHTQETGRSAGATCASASCHIDWRDNAFHRGVSAAQRCMSCHLPHSWRVDGENCLRCHQDIRRQAPSRRLAARTPYQHPGAPVVELASRGVSDAEWLPLTHAPQARQAPQAPQAPRAARPQVPLTVAARPTLPAFSHGDHRRESCGSCHSSRAQHGQVTLASARDCATCHHAGEARQQCSTCHNGAALPRPTPRPRTFAIAASRDSVTRPIPFAHLRHAEVSCARCHANTVQHELLPAARCENCHAQHHTPTSNCLTCHAAANTLAAHTVESHTTCATAACHGQAAAGLPASREACLVCHQAQATHERGKLCEQCHRVTT